MASNLTTAERVKEIISEFLDDPDLITSDAVLNDLDDAGDWYEIFEAINKEFGIELDPDAPADSLTVGGLVSMVEEALSET